MPLDKQDWVGSPVLPSAPDAQTASWELGDEILDEVVAAKKWLECELGGEIVKLLKSMAKLLTLV